MGALLIRVAEHSPVRSHISSKNPYPVPSLTPSLGPKHMHGLFGSYLSCHTDSEPGSPSIFNSDN